jgi:hypothetical protein
MGSKHKSDRLTRSVLGLCHYRKGLTLRVNCSTTARRRLDSETLLLRTSTTPLEIVLRRRSLLRTARATAPEFTSKITFSHIDTAGRKLHGERGNGSWLKAKNCGYCSKTGPISEVEHLGRLRYP